MINKRKRDHKYMLSNSSNKAFTSSLSGTPIILICCACMIAGMVMIYTNYLSAPTDYSYYVLGLFFIGLGAWGVYKENQYIDKEKMRRL